MDWLCQYVKYPNVYIACNTDVCADEFRIILDGKIGSDDVSKVLYFPNYYVEPPKAALYPVAKDSFHIGCFRRHKSIEKSVVTTVLQPLNIL